MGWVALKMLTGDRAKYFGLVFGIAFASMLMAHQTSIFCGLMLRTTSQLQDIRGAEIWVTDPKLQNVDEIKPLSDGDLYGVRSVPDVAWAVRLYKGLVRVRVEEGDFRTAILLGLDDPTLIGAPQRMVVGELSALRQPDAVIIDDAGFAYLWPGERLAVGKTLEMNDRRAVIVGICKASAPFQTFPVMYTRYSQATWFVPRERNLMSFVLAEPEPQASAGEVCRRIEQQTGLQALTRRELVWKTIDYYLRSTGIPVNFGITVALGFIVGTAVAGQTFYLFTIENLKQFGALKAMGVSNFGMLGMILLQALVVGAIGYGLGMGLAAAFFEVTKDISHLRGFYMPWQVSVGTLVAVGLIIVFASVLSIRRVWVLEPAIVFRGS
ncbi:MAG: FtsX-like permease family protein [Planctomycetes bacterium]|nr:FtsX-like permease family protein [Planctomycetota bacterium]